eukprot:996208-Pelagomonas_calceolata.AAC.2
MAGVAGHCTPHLNTHAMEHSKLPLLQHLIIGRCQLYAWTLRCNEMLAQRVSISCIECLELLGMHFQFRQGTLKSGKLAIEHI